MVQVEMSNMYIDMGVNNGSEKWRGKNTAASDMLIKAVYVEDYIILTGNSLEETKFINEGELKRMFARNYSLALISLCDVPTHSSAFLESVSSYSDPLCQYIQHSPGQYSDTRHFWYPHQKYHGASFMLIMEADVTPPFPAQCSGNLSLSVKQTVLL